MAFATNIYAEMTPNPATMKFVADRVIVNGHGIAEYFNANEAKDSSELAEKLFMFPFIKSVFFVGNFVTVTKNETIGWDFITMELREFITGYLRENEFAVQRVPEAKNSAGSLAGEDKKDIGATISDHVEPKNEMEMKIISILDEYVRPAVENDGGAIHFKSFEGGKVNLVLRGSCSGCPSSMITLKSGVETLMKQMLPEVTEVVAVEG